MPEDVALVQRTNGIPAALDAVYDGFDGPGPLRVDLILATLELNKTAQEGIGDTPWGDPI